MDLFPSEEEYLRAAGTVPVSACLPWTITPGEAFSRLASGAHAALLESAAPNPVTGRWSIVAFEPAAVLESKGQKIRLAERGAAVQYRTGDPIAALRDLLRGRQIKRPRHLPPFFGGIITCLGYDLARLFETLPNTMRDDLHLPDVCALLIDTAVIFDHERKVVWITHSPSPSEIGNRRATYRSAADRVREIAGRMITTSTFTRSAPGCQVRMQNEISEDQYISMVRTCQEYIAAGDIYQANVSQRFSGEFRGDPWALYQRLTQINPSPFAAYFRSNGFQLISASPERLVQLENGWAETRPIAGTRPRGLTPAEDSSLARDLMNSAKERAEHVMLVDLERNDLGRVCCFGSVAVNQFMTTERYSHVMHIVSNVRGQIRSELDGFDLLRAVFPGGTITGVPKIRCMKIIAEIEPVSRGPYTGSLGYISFGGDMDLNIIIRTIVLAEQRALVQVGAGIVADSIPRREYQETLDKAQALLQALR